jgi:hypothetical protein
VLSYPIPRSDKNVHQEPGLVKDWRLQWQNLQPIALNGGQGASEARGCSMIFTAEWCIQTEQPINPSRSRIPQMIIRLFITWPGLISCLWQLKAYIAR